jgi:hypothetical protein
MRELVYVSQRKLSQFQPERPRGGFLRRITGLGAKAPLSMGEISLTLVDSNAYSGPHLNDVLEELESRRRRVQWYEDEAVRVGDWVQFEALMNYGVVEERILPDPPLLFWEPGRDYPSDGSAGPSFLLHGSPDGLVGNPAGVSVGIANSDPVGLARALQLIRDSDESLAAGPPLDGWNWAHALSKIIQRLNRYYPPFMAGWLAGYARVTGIVPPSDDARDGYILATPLYVERVSEPENE